MNHLMFGNSLDIGIMMKIKSIITCNKIFIAHILELSKGKRH